MPTDGPRSRKWVFTLNNYTDADRARIGESLAPNATYVVYQPELAPTTGTPHLQGCVFFRNARTRDGVKRLISDRCFCDPMRGSDDEAIDYCSDERKIDATAGFGVTEHGTKPNGPGQGARTDLAGIGIRLREGASLAIIAQENPADFIRYHQGIRALQAIVQCQPRVPGPDGEFVPPRVHWWYGSTGSGKTRAVYHACGEEALYVKPPGNKWFDGYCGQKHVLFDDFRGDWWSFGYLLQILDRYPMQVEVKGGYVAWSPTHVYITCPRKPEDVYAGLEAAREGSLAQLTRRITEVKLYGDEPAPPAAHVLGFDAN